MLLFESLAVIEDQVDGWAAPAFPITCFSSHFLMSGFPVSYILSFNKQVLISDHPGREQSRTIDGKIIPQVRGEKIFQGFE